MEVCDQSHAAFFIVTRGPAKNLGKAECLPLLWILTLTRWSISLVKGCYEAFCSNTNVKTFFMCDHKYDQ